MHARALEEFCEGVESILRAAHPDGGGLELAGALAEFRAALAVVSDPASHDLEDRSTGSLTRADALRIRGAKFIALHLPAGRFADPALRRRIGAELRALTERVLGPLARSDYLDDAARRGGAGEG